MRIYVYDTYVEAKSGQTMHFDVFMPVQDADQAVAYARCWLRSIHEKEASITTNECRFCHSEQTSDPTIVSAIEKQGYFIYKMEGCP